MPKKLIKVKTISRNPDDYLRETKHDIHKLPRNYDPALHPFDVPREYTRALNAVKLERIFAKPFLGSLDGHRDGVSVMINHPSSLSGLISASCDGEIRLWNLAERKCASTIQAHSGIVRGVCAPKSGEYFFSVGDDKTVKMWDMDMVTPDVTEPKNTVIAKTMLTGISHHRTDKIFATCGERVDIWEENRSEPLRSLQWGVDSLHSVKFNPIETDVLASTASDRSIILYDIRESSPIRKVVMEMRANTICWNPMEAFIFTAASEDHNCYTFDIRNLKTARQVHTDHVSAVIDLDYSPTGKEFVSGSYDKTLRIFPVDKGHSREVYHTKRMQRLSCILWSLDNRYILSGSDEMNIRLWKAVAWEKLGQVRHREKTVLNYNEKLKEKFIHHPQVKRIARHRHVPKHVYNARNEKRIMIQSRKRKEGNRRAHSKPGTVPFVAERQKHIVQEDE